MASSYVLQAQKCLTYSFLITSVSGFAGNLLLNPFPIALKNIALLGADFSTSYLANQKLAKKIPSSAYIALHSLGAAYFSYRLFDSLKNDPLNPQAFCELTSIIWHAGSAFLHYT